MSWVGSAGRCLRLDPMRPSARARRARKGAGRLPLHLVPSEPHGALGRRTLILCPRPPPRPSALGGPLWHIARAGAGVGNWRSHWRGLSASYQDLTMHVLDRLAGATARDDRERTSSSLPSRLLPSLHLFSSRRAVRRRALLCFCFCCCCSLCAAWPCSRAPYLHVVSSTTLPLSRSLSFVDVLRAEARRPHSASPRSLSHPPHHRVLLDAAVMGTTSTPRPPPSAAGLTTRPSGRS